MNYINRFSIFTILSSLFLTMCSSPGVRKDVDFKASGSYEQLVDFFVSWREFRVPGMIDGVPDYTKEAMDIQFRELPDWQKKLNAF